MRKIAITLGFLIASLTLVTAFGISSSYWDGNPLEMYPGQSTTISFNLQNKAGATDDVTVDVALLEGSEIATLKKTRYVVKAGGEEDVNLDVKIPENTTIGSEYKIRIEVKTVTPSESETVSIGTGMISAFDVLVTEKFEEDVEVPSAIPFVFYIIGAIIVIGIIVLLARRKK